MVRMGSRIPSKCFEMSDLELHLAIMGRCLGIVSDGIGIEIIIKKFAIRIEASNFGCRYIFDSESYLNTCISRLGETGPEVATTVLAKYALKIFLAI